MWEWDCSAPDGSGGGGASDDEQGARSAAEKWMREHRGAAARAAPVDLDAMESAYVPAGPAIEAAAHDGGRITWQPAAQ
jgi:hypothetical protein